MSLILVANTYAIAPGISTSFLGTGGVTPCTYSVLSGGAGGSIVAGTGIYTAPASFDNAKLYDTIQVTDHIGATATAQILVGNPLLLFCDIIQTEMGLANGRVYLWDQKINQPKDSDIYIAISVMHCKPFGNSNVFNSDGTSTQSINMLAMLSIDIMSRGTGARDRKEEILLALNSNYAKYQQALNCFKIGLLPSGGNFVNLSNIDGAAIPYRFNVSINLQYFYTKTKAVDYFSTFSSVVPITNP